MSVNINQPYLSPAQQMPQVQMVPMQGLIDQQNLYGMDATQDQRKNRIIELFNYAGQFKQFHHKRWKRNYEYYLGWDNEIKNRAAHQSKLFIPRPFLVVETKTPRLVQSLLSKDPIFTVKPQSGDDIMRARISSELISQQLRNHPNMILELVTWFKDSFIYGGAVGMTGWQFQQEYKTWRQQSPPSIDFITGQLLSQEQVVSDMVTVIDRPYFKNIDIGEIFPDPTADCIENCKFVIRQQLVPYVTIQQLEQLGVYQNCGKIPRSGSIPQQYDDFVNRRFSVGNMSKPTSNLVQMSSYDQIELLECWWIDETGRKMKTVLANKQVIIQDIPLPYWHNKFPFYLLKDIPMTKEFWGMGDIDPIYDLCKAINDLTNQQHDNIQQFLKAFWAVDRNANVDLDQLENMPPGGIIETTGDPKAGLTVIRPPQLDSMTTPAIQQLNSEVQIASGANDIAIGQSTRSQSRSATNSQLMDASTDTRYGLTAMLYLEQVRNIGSDWLALDQQFMTKPVMVRVFGQEGLIDYHATPYDIPREWDLYCTLGSEFQGNKEVQKQQSMQLFQILSMFPWFNAPEYVMDLMQQFDVKDPQRFIVGGQGSIPTQMIMQQLGIGDSSVMSGYQEMEGGKQGGGQQSNPRARQPIQFGQATGTPDILQQTQGGGGMRVA